MEDNVENSVTSIPLCCDFFSKWCLALLEELGPFSRCPHPSTLPSAWHIKHCLRRRVLTWPRPVRL